jgi:hypothetical protein
MRNLATITLFSCLFLAVLLTMPVAADPLAKSADIKVEISPETLHPGDSARITVWIAPLEGVKINRYPKIKLKIPALEGVVEAALTEIGDEKPPPPDKLETNYYATVDPVVLELPISATAPTGTHKLDAKLNYFYCVKKSGFCAPARLSLEIDLDVN